MAAPKTSLRPVAPGELEQKGREMLGDVEFRADLERSGTFDPVAKLGLKSGSKGRLQLQPLDQKAFTLVGDNPEAAGIKPEYHTEQLKPGDVSIRSDFTTPAVWSHEFRHAGIKVIEERLKNEGVEFLEKYGPDGLDLANALKNPFLNEALTELFDASNKDKMVRSHEQWETKEDITLGGTISDINRIPPETRQALMNVMTEVAIDMLENKDGEMDKAKEWLRSTAKGRFE